ncbi:MAG TPA: hypothetical protein VGH50_17670, partial [Candidatus Binatia bacterium]
MHAAALAYPAFYNAPVKAPPLVVTIVEAEGGGGGAGNSSAAEKAGGAPAAHSEPQKQMTRPPSHTAMPPRAVESAAVAERPKTAEPVAIAAPAEPIALPLVETQAQSVTSVPVRESAVTVAVESGAVSPKTIAGTGASANSDSSGAGRDSGAGSRGAGSGSGLGSGMGSGLGSGTGTGNGPGKGNGELPSVNASY